MAKNNFPANSQLLKMRFFLRLSYYYTFTDTYNTHTERDAHGSPFTRTVHYIYVCYLADVGRRAKVSILKIDGWFFFQPFFPSLNIFFFFVILLNFYLFFFYLYILFVIIVFIPSNFIIALQLEKRTSVNFILFCVYFTVFKNICCISFGMENTNNINSKYRKKEITFIEEFCLSIVFVYSSGYKNIIPLVVKYENLYI